MALRHSAFYSPYLMTMAGGFLKEEGLDYQYQVETPDNTVVNNFINGTCDVSQSAVAASFAFLEKGNVPPFMHFAQINARDGFFIAAREADANFNWQKLIGKRVIVDHFFQPLAMFRYGMHQQDINMDDMQILDVGDVHQIEQAFREGKADYVHMQGPAPQQMEYEKIASVVAAVSDAIGPVAFSSLCAEPKWLTTAEAKAFIKAYQKALNYVINAPAEEIAAQEQQAGFFPDIEFEVLSKTIEAYQQLGCWEDDTRISRESYDKVLDVFLYSGAISQRYAYDQVISTASQDQ